MTSLIGLMVTKVNFWSDGAIVQICSSERLGSIAPGPTCPFWGVISWISQKKRKKKAPPTGRNTGGTFFASFVTWEKTITQTEAALIFSDVLFQTIICDSMGNHLILLYSTTVLVLILGAS